MRPDYERLISLIPCTFGGHQGQNPSAPVVWMFPNPEIRGFFMVDLLEGECLPFDNEPSCDRSFDALQPGDHPVGIGSQIVVENGQPIPAHESVLLDLLNGQPPFAFEQPPDICELPGVLEAVAHDADQAHAHGGEWLVPRLIQFSVEVCLGEAADITLRPFQHGPVILQQGQGIWRSEGRHVV